MTDEQKEKFEECGLDHEKMQQFVKVRAAIMETWGYPSQEASLVALHMMKECGKKWGHRKDDEDFPGSPKKGVQKGPKGPKKDDDKGEAEE